MSRLLLVRINKKLTFSHKQYCTPDYFFFKSGYVSAYAALSMHSDTTIIRCRCVKLAANTNNLAITENCYMDYSKDFSKILLGIIPTNLDVRSIRMLLFSGQIDLKLKIKPLYKIELWNLYKI